ncbi:MAG: penicillin acylase family protein [Candidatus Heimdallarchaeota archaeon]|nr:penicillin acylase family protein [Candidatus Heimdallarchaeota archaeon]
MSAGNKILGTILRSVFKIMDKSRLPKIEGELTLPGLLDKVTVTRDRDGVPHIRAKSNHDLFFTQGFIHAQERLYQMEMNRRTASGRLSEIFGSMALDTDRTARTFGWRRIGIEDWNNAEEPIKEAVNAYVAGINAHLNSLDTKSPLEFFLIKHKPELWDHEDVMALSRLMIWKLSHAWYGELIRASIIDAVGPEHAKELEIEYPEDNPNTLPDDIEFNIYLDETLKKIKGPWIKQSLGSNTWVISKERSATGTPILSNDMHLPMQLPSLWFLNHLKSDEINVTGVSIPGLPLVLVGHNEHMSWGMTLAFTDAEDLYIEKISKDNPLQYHFKTELRDLKVVEEQINIKDEIPHVEKVKFTHHGPIISDVVGLAENQRISVCSKSLESNQAIYGWYKLNIAKDWNDFVDAIQLIEAPQLNVSYADKENIGYYTSGRIPKRAKGHTGMIPVEGWTGNFEWGDMIPFEEMPHALNPEKGIIVSCNNKIVSDDYPHYLGSVWMNGYRAKRIEDYFDTLDKISIEDCKKIMLDYYSIPGLQFIEHYKDVKLNDHDPRVNHALEIMKNWDGNLTADSVGGCLYSVVKYMMVRHIFEPNLGKELTDTVMGTGFHPLLLDSHEFYGHDTVTILRMLENAENSWWVNHAGGKDKLLRDSFNRAYEWLRKNMGLNPDKWTWGKIHSIEFPHSMSIQPPMDVVFNKGPFPIGGDTDTACQMAYFPEQPFMAKSWVPSIRQIADMGDVANSQYMYAPGQSGQLSSKHYADLIKKWIIGEFNTLYWTRGQIEKEAEGTLNLNP